MARRERPTVLTTAPAWAFAVCAVLGLVIHPARVLAEPTLRSVRFIQTTPFVGSSVEMRDGEGMTFVPVNNTLWLGDDDGKRVYEVDKDSGRLLSSIGAAELANALDFATRTTPAGSARAEDIEGLAYDAWSDVLYVFSANCCPKPPTAFRLVRGGGGQFQVETYQALPSSSNFTGAAFHPTEGRLYVSDDGAIKPYDYVTNTAGAVVPIDGVNGVIFGMDFSDDGKDLWVVTSSDEVYRIDWETKRVVTGYAFDLVAQGINDGRAVDFVGGQLYVLDGYNLPDSDPRRFAVTVFDIGDAATPSAPTNLAVK